MRVISFTFRNSSDKFESGGKSFEVMEKSGKMKKGHSVHVLKSITLRCS